MNNGYGISTFFYFAIPAVLALAALWWLAFGEGVHTFSRQLSQEQRAAGWVGATIRPRQPVKVEAVNEPDNPVQITRVQFDGSDLWVYYESSGDVDYIKFRWKQYAPDGTVVASEHGYPSIDGEGQSTDALTSGEKGELHLKIKSDPRAVTMKVWMGLNL